MQTIEDKARALHDAKNTGIAWSDLKDEARQKMRDEVAVKHQAEETMATIVEATGLTEDQARKAVAGLKKLGYLRELHDLDV
jgi:hypothetical protein